MTPTNKLGYMMQHVAAVVCKQSDQLLQQQLDLRLSQLRILMVLQQKTQLQQSQIADCLGQTEASISRQIQVLNSRGLLTSERDPINKRKHITKSTAEGITLTVAAHKLLTEHFGPIYAAMGQGAAEQLLANTQQLHLQICRPGLAGTCDRQHQPILPKTSLA